MLATEIGNGDGISMQHCKCAVCVHVVNVCMCVTKRVVVSAFLA